MFAVTQQQKYNNKITYIYYNVRAPTWHTFIPFFLFFDFVLKH